MKVLFINPNKWGRGITPIWIASHSALLIEHGCTVELFDATFYKEWTDNELEFNTLNAQYKESEYNNFIKFNNNSIFRDLQKKIDEYKPDIIFLSALSSHIHGEGEYVNIEYAHDLISNVDTKSSLIIAGGLQATANPTSIFERFKNIQIVISGESELVLLEIINNLLIKKSVHEIDGISYKSGNEIKTNNRQKIIDNLDVLGKYNYQLFDPQIFLRPYQGNVIRVIDYEISRGCIYACSYCVETVIQKYYGFEELTPRGAIRDSKKYIRHKSANRILEEIGHYKKDLKIDLLRCQDTNFLTINKKLLTELAEIINGSDKFPSLYIETRPEGINNETVKLLKQLNVIGVGMGVELASQEEREGFLNRYSNQDKIINAFKMLKESNIKTTAYNVIGFPKQNEHSILETIKFNKILNPDNITVAFYSPYMGTSQERLGTNLGKFVKFQSQVDGQLRSTNNSPEERDMLNYYKQNFNKLVRNE